MNQGYRGWLGWGSRLWRWGPGAPGRPRKGGREVGGGRCWWCREAVNMGCRPGGDADEQEDDNDDDCGDARRETKPGGRPVKPARLGGSWRPEDGDGGA